MSTPTPGLNARNVLALADGLRLLESRIAKLTSELQAKDKAIHQLMAKVAKLERQQILAMTNVGNGPTVGA